jgi:hypothetical protein
MQRRHHTSPQPQAHPLFLNVRDKGFHVLRGGSRTAVPLQVADMDATR